MELENFISKDLWEKVKNNYQNESYKNAILDGTNYLGELLRSKSGLETDGTKLVSQALRGENPVLKATKLKTESDKSIQKGLSDICSGIFSLIRNPRSHGESADTKNDAKSVIIMIDFVTKQLRNAKSPFESHQFIMTRVYDKGYVYDHDYSALLVNEVPEGKKLSVIYEMLNMYGDNFYGGIWFAHSLLMSLTDEEVQEFITFASEELKSTNDKDFILRAVTFIPRDIFLKIDELARRRVEMQVINSYKNGLYDFENKTVKNAESLGTWYSNFHEIGYYSNKYLDAFNGKLESNDKGHYEYALNYTLHYLPSIVKNHDERVNKNIGRLLSNENQFIKNQMDKWKESNSEFLERAGLDKLNY